jgi:hypothetical protein
LAPCSIPTSPISDLSPCDRRVAGQASGVLETGFRRLLVEWLSWPLERSIRHEFVRHPGGARTPIGRFGGGGWTWRDVSATFQLVPAPATAIEWRDENTGLITLFGGCTDDCGSYPDATIVDHQFSLGTGSWSSVTVTRPSARCCEGLVYASYGPFSSLSNAPGVFLFGGADNIHNGLNDLYFYTGGAWCKVTGATTCSSSW